MNAREKEFYEQMKEVGIALMNAARKTNITQDTVHHIMFNPESGYVDCIVFVDGKTYDAYRFDQFPEWTETCKE